MASRPKRTYYIYCHTAPNGKRYIGQTCQKLNARWNHGERYQRNGGPFRNAIDKYGWDSFTHTVLATCNSSETADSLEKILIRLYRTTEREFGYNLSAGGGGCSGYCIPDEQRQKISNSLKGHEVPEEVRRKISDSLKAHPYDRTFSEEGLQRLRDRRGDKHPCYGKHISDEHKQKISAYWKGRSRSKDSIRQAVDTKRAKGVYKKISRPVIQYDMSGNEISRFDSAAAAGRSVGRPDTCIIGCCKGKSKHSAGFIWRYVEPRDGEPATAIDA